MVLGLFIISNSFGQVDSVGLKNAMQQLDNGLLKNEKAVLQSVLHKSVSYGHSNGWIQNKKDVLNDYESGKMIYKKIEKNSSSIVSINKKWATVKTNTNVEGEVSGTAFNLKLHVLQVWMKTKKGWQLYARQSAKIN